MTAMAAAATVSPTSITPAGGFINTPIKEVVIEFPIQYNSVEFSENALKYYDPNESVDKEGRIYFGGEENEQGPDMYSAKIDGTTVTFTANEYTSEKGAPMTWDKPGKYSLMIPEGALIFTAENGETEVNTMLNIIWVLGEYENPYVLPAEGEVTDMSKITIKLPEGYNIAGGYPLNVVPKVYNADEAGNKIGTTPIAQYKTLENKDNWKGGTELIFTNPKTVYPIGDFVPVHGSYYLVEIPESMFFIAKDGAEPGVMTPSLQMNMFYYFLDNGGMAEIKYTLTPATDEPVDARNLERLELSVSTEDYEAITPNLDKIEDEGAKATLTCGDKVVALEPKEGSNYTTVLLEIPERLTAGTWTLDIPEAYFFVEVIENDLPKRIYSAPIKATYTIIDSESTAVDAIDAANGAVEAVSIDGITYKVDSVKELPKGIWIINGNKVTVK